MKFCEKSGLLYHQRLGQMTQKHVV